MIVRRFHQADNSACSYLITAPRSGASVLIDPVLEAVPEYTDTIARLGLRLVATIETHLHEDHITGAFQLRSQHGSQVLYPAGLGALGVDGELTDGDEVVIGSVRLRALATPGQTAHALSIYAGGKHPAVFTGDVLHAAGVPLPDDRSSYSQLLRSIRSRLFVLPDQTLVYPGHDPVPNGVTTIQAERMLNPFARESRSLTDFIQTMEAASWRAHFTLSGAGRHNLLAGAVESSIQPSRSSALRRLEQLAGPRHITAEWLAANHREVSIVDFRDDNAFAGAHILGAARVTAQGIPRRVQGLPRSMPIVSIAADTSDHAQLHQLGFSDLAQAAPDPDAWRAAGLPVVAIPSTPIAVA